MRVGRAFLRLLFGGDVVDKLYAVIESVGVNHLVLLDAPHLTPVIYYIVAFLIRLITHTLISLVSTQ